MLSFQEIIHKLSQYWASLGCNIQFGYDLEVGAGTFNPATFFRSLGPEPYKSAYVEPSRRPTDGRYGDNPNRLQHYFQFQVVLKPSPLDIQDLYLGSLEVLGLKLKDHDIRFIHDDWKSPTLGAWGLGWEVQVDGMEVSQFTYFQCMGGIELSSVTGEITYGLERLAMYLQNVESCYNIHWSPSLTYGDIYHQSEVQWSTYNFEEADTRMWKTHFDHFEQESLKLIKKDLPIPAYDFIMKASHAFNLLEARGILSVTERALYIGRIRTLSCAVAKAFLKFREKEGYPLLKNSIKAPPLKSKPLRSVRFDPDKKEDFLLEIGTEELPQSFIPIGIKNLKIDLEQFFKAAGLSYNTLNTYGTPRRLVAYVEGLSSGTPPSLEKKKGPPLNKAFLPSGEATPLGEGFLSSLGHVGVKLRAIQDGKLTDLAIEEINGTDYLMVTHEKLAVSTYELLSRSLEKLLLNLEFPQKMVWSDLGIPFPRPLRWLCALLGSEPLDFSIAGIQSGSTSYGHRLISPAALEIKVVKDYFKIMEKHGVIVDQERRGEIIREELNKMEKKLNATALDVSDVLKEVVYLTEYPTLILGDFDSKYLEAPKELLQLVMIVHQRYFPLENPQQKLIPHFVVCIDNKPSEKMKKGHEKAITPRLADGLFVYDQDLNTGLEEMVEKLDKMTFQKELGSLGEKSKRMALHALILNRYVQGATPDQINGVAPYLKADLASQLVFEFPELQGIIGSHYAEHAKKEPFIVEAIKEHWLPRFDEDHLPKSQIGILFALADRLDNLLSCFLTNKIPSSSSDPHALRRQTLGIIRILIENRIHIPLDKMIQECAKHFPLPFNEESYHALILFISSRFKTVLTQYDLKPDEIQAVLSSESLDLYDLFLRAKSLHEFKTEKQFEPFLEVYKRVKGQLSVVIKQPIRLDLFQTEAERHLYHHFSAIQEELSEAFDEKKYEAAFILLSSFQPHLARFFEEVKVLEEDEKLRMNRLALLQLLYSLFNHLLDFSVVKPN